MTNKGIDRNQKNYCIVTLVIFRSFTSELFPQYSSYSPGVTIIFRWLQS